jgi:hypothetical protein
MTAAKIKTVEIRRWSLNFLKIVKLGVEPFRFFNIYMYFNYVIYDFDSELIV